MDPTPTDARRRRLVATLTIGYLALAVATIAARTDPATGWELSIYRATPALFWVGVVVAVAAGAYAATAAPPRSVPARLGVALAPLAVVALVGLPILRGYHFFGAGDALSYLGWARRIDRGTMNPLEFLYPGMETTAILLAEATGLSIRRALATVPAVFALVYVVGVGLVVDRIATGSRALAAGVVAAALLAPINNVHTYLIPYPTTMAIFFTPLVAYFLFRYVGDGPAGAAGRRSIAGPFGVLVALAGVATVLYHPQIGANVVVLLAVVLGLQLAARRYGGRLSRAAVADHRSVLAPTLVVGGFFFLWTPRFERASGTAASLVSGLVGDGPTGEEIATRGSSLTELGSGLLELGLKLFGVTALLSLVAVAVAVAALVRVVGGRSDDRPRSDRSSLVAYLALSAAPVAGLFVLFYAASISVQPFRYLGFLMAVATVLAAVAVADGVPVDPPVPSSWRAPAAVAVVIVLLVPQVAMVFASPYIYQPNSQVPETRMDGYATAFEHRDSDVWFAGLRGGPRRYVDAHYGTTTDETTPGGSVFEGKDEAIPFRVWGSNLTEFYSRCRYVAITDADYQREVGLYDGLRYGADGFRQLRTDADVHRVQSNGNFRLYLVTPEGATCTR